MAVLDGLRPFYDVVVVGARAAGASTAMLLARSGQRVLLIDRQPYGSDTLSTHALMRGGVLALHRWGLLDRVIAAGTPPVRRTIFRYGDDEVALDIKHQDGVNALYAPRRTVIDPVLVDAARQAGAEIRHGVALTAVERTAGGRVSGVVIADRSGATRTVGTDLIVGADGRRSTVADLVGAATYRSGRQRAAGVYTYVPDLPDEGYIWCYRAGASLGVIPTNGGEHCVAASMPPDRFRAEIQPDLAAGLRRMVKETFPALAPAVREGAGRHFGFAGTTGYFKQSFGPGWALVGDAGYFKDPITAHGMTDAFRDAELLVNAIQRGGTAALADYQAERDALSLPLFEATDAIASLAWDLATLQEHHLALNRAMKAEVRHLADLSPRPLAA
jgi:2-polyprenyl-6-methoxyphenol hydroxylase-like FAD-dependent oxidoreductase